MKFLISLLLVINIIGCHQRDLDADFADYFSLINRTKDKSFIISAKHELENIVQELEHEQSIHLSDFQFLLNLYRAAEISWSVDNPKRMKRLIRMGMHPAHNTAMLKQYQRAAQPQYFSEKVHMTALYSALDLSQKFEFSASGKKYYFADLMRKWSEQKRVHTRAEMAQKIAKGLEEGVCRGVAIRANQLFCEDSTRTAQSIIDSINTEYDQTLLFQIQGNIAARLARKGERELGEAYMKSLEEGAVFHLSIPGFWLKYRVREFMDKIVSAVLLRKKDFSARVSFRGNKTGHAVAIQILKASEFRIIDNNVGVLSYNTKEEFLDAFATYRLPYYIGQSVPVMKLYGDFCP